YLGCFGDSTSDRVLSGPSFKNEASLTIESCGALCVEYAYFGVQYGKECFCGRNSDDPDELGGATCNMACTGNENEACGGRSAMNVYEYAEPFGKYAGCFVDNTRDRVLTGDYTSDSDMTLEFCSIFCGNAPFYGTEYGRECFCGEDGDNFDRYGQSSSCTMNCTGDDEQICGGSNAISVYYGGPTPEPPPAPPTPAPVPYTGEYAYLGCFADSSTARALTGESFMNQENLTIDRCAMVCTGYAYFGTQFGNECFCGRTSDDPDELGRATCNMSCAGDASETCGGRLAISVYEYTESRTSGYAGCFVDKTGTRALTGNS
ncbi:unnamed protein product, partial [Sphacelaria rigidula]